MTGFVARWLKRIDDLGIADNTIVIYSTDNGAETMSWPDGGNHAVSWREGNNLGSGFRIPLVVRWPGAIKPGTVDNSIISHEDWMPTLLALLASRHRGET